MLHRLADGGFSVWPAPMCACDAHDKPIVRLEVGTASLGLFSSSAGQMTKAMRQQRRNLLIDQMGEVLACHDRCVNKGNADCVVFSATCSTALRALSPRCSGMST
jgi:hypothetical protein